MFENAIVELAAISPWHAVLFWPIVLLSILNIVFPREGSDDRPKQLFFCAGFFACISVGLCAFYAFIPQEACNLIDVITLSNGSYATAWMAGSYFSLFSGLGLTLKSLFRKRTRS